MASKMMTGMMAAAAMIATVPMTAAAAHVRPGNSLVSAQAASLTSVTGVQRQGATIRESSRMTPADLLALLLTLTFTTTGTILFTTESP